VLAACAFAPGIGCGKPGAGGGAGGTTVGSTAPASTASTAKSIQDRIASDSSLKGASVTVKEESGTISLEGTVDNQEQKDKAESIVYAVQKEKNLQSGVLNNLMIKESSAAAPGSAGAKGNGGH
jgi:osmotically-inducible protein OsmY